MLYAAADRIEKRFKSIEIVLSVLLVLALVVFVALTAYFYCAWINDPSKADKDDDYLGFI